MYIQQLYTNCLAQAAYYIESNGEAAIIDPLRDVDIYTELAESRHSKIKFIFETHFHADFVSGHLDLTKKTGAEIIFGPDAKPNYEAHIAKDDEYFVLGDCKLQVLHTPGHTIESICVMLYDNNGHAHSIFTGDTLFVGDVGRPDLLSGNLPKEVLAGKLYDSIRKKIMPIEDHVIVYPGHGPGSPCGRSLGKETTSTIGIQKKLNYALQPMSKEKFIDAVIKDQPLPPPYFFKDALINKAGYDQLELILQKEMTKVKAAQIKEHLEAGNTILDVRSADHFSFSHIKGSINIGLNGTFAIWAGTVINLQKPILLICEHGKEKESMTRLGRIGFENIVGYYSENIDDLAKSGITLSPIPNIEAHQLTEKIATNIKIIDVRTNAEVESGIVKGAIHIPLNVLDERKAELNINDTYYIYCAGGYRSMIASSILEKSGFNNIVNIRGGMNSIAKECNSIVEKEPALHQ